MKVFPDEKWSWLYPSHFIRYELPQFFHWKSWDQAWYMHGTVYQSQFRKAEEKTLLKSFIYRYCPHEQLGLQDIYCNAQYVSIYC